MAVAPLVAERPAQPREVDGSLGQYTRGRAGRNSSWWRRGRGRGGARLVRCGIRGGEGEKEGEGRGAPLVRCGIREWIGVLSPSEAAAIGVPFGHTPPGGPSSVHLHDGPTKDSRVPPTEERAQERSGACIAHVISRAPSARCAQHGACSRQVCAVAGAVTSIFSALWRACVGAVAGAAIGAVSGECASAPSCIAERVRPA